MVLQFRLPLRQATQTIQNLFRQCTRHRFLLPLDCVECQQVDQFDQPRKPCQWYRSVQYLIPTTGEPHSIDVNGGQQYLPMVRTTRAGASGDAAADGEECVLPIVVQGIAVDAVGQAWLVGRLLLKLRSLVRSTVQYNANGTMQTTEAPLDAQNLPRDVDLGLESVENNALVFYPFVDVVSWCFVGWCGPTKFQNKHAQLPRVVSAPYKCCCRYQLKPGHGIGLEPHPRSIAEQKKL